MEKQREAIGGHRLGATASVAVRFTGMIRACLIAACLLAAMGAVASAQTPDLDNARVLMLQQQLESARLQALDAQREVYAAQDRLRTEQVLNSLEAGRQAAAPPPALAPLPYSLTQTPAPPDAAASLNNQHAVDAERIRQLQDEALARSNARILAVRPAL